MLERILPVVGEPSTEMRFDLRDHELVRPADEPFDHLSFTQDPTQLGEDSHVDADGKALAIYQHAVAVEDDELDRPGHDRAK
jgi:hypothetical protein